MARCERFVIAVTLLLAGCVVPRPDAKLPEGNRSYVAVLSGEMPPPLDRVARHSWIVTHRGEADSDASEDDGSYRRFELGRGSTRHRGRGPGAEQLAVMPTSYGGPFEDFAAGDVMLHGVVELSSAALDKMNQCLKDAEEDYYKEYPGYLPIPGPNSNTFVAYLIRRCDLDIELPASAIGRDYVGLVGAQLTEGGTGIQLGTFAFGLRLGLKEGIEVHLFGLPLGVHFWPPGINVPVNPGRIGFASDGHKYMPHEGDAPQEEGARLPDVDRPSPGGLVSPRLAVLRAIMAARTAAIAEPESAGGLQGQLTVGLGTRGLYGGRIGYGYGLDFELGASAPLGFAGSVHLYPLGVGLTLPASGYLAFFSGVGTSGATGTVPAALALPQEVRVAFDGGQRLRVEAFAAGAIVLGDNGRRTGRFFDERAAGLFVRVGKLRGGTRGRGSALGSGYAFGVEAREVLRSVAVSLTIGTEIDFGM